MAAPRFLFIVRYRSDSGGNCPFNNGSLWTGGLYYSALFVVQMLNSFGIFAQIEQVVDNNSIDAVVAKWQPTTVIIEGLWVVPEKFAVLQKLWPAVTWIVRCHSEIPFLAYEGIAIDWLLRYVKYENLAIASNSTYGTRDFEAVIHAAESSWGKDQIARKVFHLPNWYPQVDPLPLKKPNNVLDVGCLGAIRPLKNQLIQAVAAVEWAQKSKKLLNFHVNGRVEQCGDSVLKNIAALLKGTGNVLVEHPWVPRDQFLARLAGLDLGMQVSFSETFDITAADTVALGVPLVTSNEVVWSSPSCQAVPTNAASIVARLKAVTGGRKSIITAENQHRLRAFCKESEETWLDFAS